MIQIKYEEAVSDPTTGATTLVQLGTETHENIAEMLLHTGPVPGSPIFFTKKFRAPDEYRWEVLSISQSTAGIRRTYRVELQRRSQQLFPD